MSEAFLFLAQASEAAAPLNLKIPTSAVALLVVAVTALFSACGYGVRWLMRLFEEQGKNFIAALERQEQACGKKLDAVLEQSNQRTKEAREDRDKDRDARRHIAGELAGVKDGLTRLETRISASGSGPYPAVGGG